MLNMQKGRSKRLKTEEDDVYDQCIFHTYPSLVRTLIGYYFMDDWQSYFALARVTKALWRDYCHYDETVRFMRFVYSRPLSARQPLILHSGLSLCVQWLWDKQRGYEARSTLAVKYFIVATEHPLLDILYMVAPFISPEDRAKCFTDCVDRLAEFGYDDALVHLVSQRLPWPLEFSKIIRVCLYFSAVKHAARLPRFYALVQTLILPDDLYPDDEFQKTVTVLSVALSGRINTVVANFGFFWNQLPQQESSRREYLTVLISNLFLRYGSSLMETLPLLIHHYFKLFATKKENNVLTFSLGRYDFIYEEKDTALNDEVLCKMTYAIMEESRVVTIVLPKALFSF